MNDPKADPKSVFSSVLNEVSIVALVHQFAAQLRGYAKEAGTSCSLSYCDALTLGVRCEACSRRVCMGHAFWQLQAPRVVPYCTYCVVERNSDLFENDDDIVEDMP